MIDYFDWAERYDPTSDEPLEWDDVKDMDKHYVWTLVDGDPEPIIVTGAHMINRLGYYTTRVPHNFENFEVL